MLGARIRMHSLIQNKTCIDIPLAHISITRTGIIIWYPAREFSQDHRDNSWLNCMRSCAGYSPCIDLFHQTSAVEQVTRGIKVRAMALALPCLMQGFECDSPCQYLLKYSIEFSHVVPEVCPALVGWLAILLAHSLAGLLPGLLTL